MKTGQVKTFRVEKKECGSEHATFRGQLVAAELEGGVHVAGRKKGRGK